MSVFLTAEWRKLIMVQYAVAPKLLMPYLPGGVELDLFKGQCFVSMVGFLFDRVRLKNMPIPFHTRFEEVNLADQGVSSVLLAEGSAVSVHSGLRQAFS